MATFRFPILTWRDPAGWFTASLVEWREPAGVGRSPEAAREQLREYLTWLYQKREATREPDFLEPRLLEVTVPIRPEYSTCERVYPCPETVSLRVVVVQGHQADGLVLCALPTMGVRFYCYEGDSPQALVTHYVQQRLEGMTPAELATYLPPREFLLDEIVVQGVLRVRKERDEPEFPTLSVVAEPFGDRRLRRQFGRAWEREAQVNELVEKLGRQRANVLVVGEPGSGKTTVIAEAVHKLDAGSKDGKRDSIAPPGKKFWLTGASRIIAGMKYLGQWEERCEEIIAELSRVGGVLCLDNVLDLVRVGGDVPTSSIAAFFLPYLQRGELRMTAEATPAELDACRRLLPGFIDAFQVVNLTPFDRSQAVAVLERLGTQLSQNLHLEIERGVVDHIYHLFRRFVPYHAFPGKAAGFLTDLAHRQRGDRAAKVGVDDVVCEFTRRTGLPEVFLRDELPLRYEDVVDTFQQQVIGQEEPCRTAASLVTTFKAGLNDPDRPVGVLLFCGPTGVGKTELAKVLSRYFFGHGDEGNRLIRLDMSEYAGPGAAQRLILRPDGEPSEFIQKVRGQPFSVVLLDEIEKADSEVFDVFLSVFDEGRLTDRYGRVTTFKSAIFVMTSNLGAGKQESFGFGTAPPARYDTEAMAFFRPEFFNRIDAVVTFQPLGEETILAITRKELAEVERREGVVKAGLKLVWTEALVLRMARDGFDSRYGARPLQRTLETRVVTPLARCLLEHPEWKDLMLRADVDRDGRVTFESASGR